jgi:hypothetical protein
MARTPQVCYRSKSGKTPKKRTAVTAEPAEPATATAQRPNTAAIKCKPASGGVVPLTAADQTEQQDEAMNDAAACLRSLAGRLRRDGDGVGLEQAIDAVRGIDELVAEADDEDALDVVMGFSEATGADQPTRGKAALADKLLDRMLGLLVQAHGILQAHADNRADLGTLFAPVFAVFKRCHAGHVAIAWCQSSADSMLTEGSCPAVGSKAFLFELASQDFYNWTCANQGSVAWTLEDEDLVHGSLSSDMARQVAASLRAVLNSPEEFMAADRRAKSFRASMAAAETNTRKLQLMARSEYDRNMALVRRKHDSAVEAIVRSTMYADFRARDDASGEDSEDGDAEAAERPTKRLRLRAVVHAMEMRAE